jgi:hypothetical protein
MGLSACRLSRPQSPRARAGAVKQRFLSMPWSSGNQRFSAIDFLWPLWGRRAKTRGGNTPLPRPTSAALDSARRLSSAARLRINQRKITLVGDCRFPASSRATAHHLSSACCSGLEAPADHAAGASAFGGGGRCIQKLRKNWFQRQGARAFWQRASAEFLGSETRRTDRSLQAGR